MFSAIGKTIRWIGQHFLGLLFILIVILVFMPKSETTLNPANLQEIELYGPIVDAEPIIKEIEKAKNDPNIRGVLLNVNSPGGTVPPSIEIAYAIKELKEQKPVVAYASGIMASGSYYSSIYADKIIANPGSIVGSIGVIMESANIEKLLDTIGIKPQIVKQGAYKEAGTPTREWTKQERQELERLTRDTYDMFVSDVAKARGLDINQSHTYADAHIFSAKRAAEVGLIDTVATKSTAKKTVAELASVGVPVWKEKDKFDTFIENLGSKNILKLQNYFYGLKASLY